MVLIQVMAGGLLLGAVYALLSSGLTLIWGMMNVVNFAHGEFVMIGMYVAYWVYTLTGGGPWIFTPLAAGVLFLAGIGVYFGLIRQVMRGPMLAQILSTFGLALFVRYAAFWAFSANYVTLPDNLVGGTHGRAGMVAGGCAIETAARPDSESCRRRPGVQDARKRNAGVAGKGAYSIGSNTTGDGRSRFQGYLAFIDGGCRALPRPQSRRILSESAKISRGY